MATSILLKFLTLKWNISRTIWRIAVGDGSLFCIFHALSFELNVFFDRRFPLTFVFGKISGSYSQAKLVNVCFNSGGQRLMVNTTHKSDLSRSAIFSVIVYFERPGFPEKYTDLIMCSQRSKKF